jgi:hypothetical protein
MAKIPLTIDPGYCEDWGAWEAIREFVSNAKDAEEEDSDHRMHVQHLPRTARLVIRSEKTVVDPSSLLVLGKTSKRGHDVRGRFGEGFAIGCLALVRAGHDLSFLNGDSKWRCEIEHADDDHPLAGSQLLTFYSRQINPSEDFEITVEGITTEIWEAMRKLFLFLDPPASIDAVETRTGTMLLGDSRRGQVFSRGVFVKHFDDLKCGYNLKDLQLDRDRRMVDEWQLHGQLAELWKDAVGKYPETMAKPVYDLAKEENAPEAIHLRWRTDDRLLKAMKDQFEEEHGVDTVPVSNMTEAKEVQALGAKPAVVNATLKDLLSKAGVSVENSKAKLEGAVVKRLDLSELSEAELAALKYVEVITKTYVVVEFRGAQTWTKPLDDDKTLGVDRRLLDKGMRNIFGAVINGEARRRNIDEVKVALDALQRSVDETLPEPSEALPDYPRPDGSTDLPF